MENHMSIKDDIICVAVSLVVYLAAKYVISDSFHIGLARGLCGYRFRYLVS